MKENSIEEALKKLTTGKKMKMYELLRTFKREGIENFVITRKKYVDVILSDYKRLQEEFKQVDHECDRLEQKEIKLEKENAQLKEDIKEMYFKEVVITIMCDNFSLSRNEALELLGDDSTNEHIWNIQ